MSTTKSKVSLLWDKIIWGILNIMVFLTPLLFSNATKESFEFPKMFFVYITGTILVCIFLIKVLWHKTVFNIGNKWLGLFVGVNVLSTIFSSHVYTSLWGYYSRFNGGLISILVLYGVYLVCINSFTLEKLKRLLTPVSLSGTIVGLYAVVQHFQINTGAENTVRIYSTLGQANWLAAFLVMVVPILLTKYLNEKNKRAIFWGISAFIAISGLWVAYSISGLIAFAVSTGVFLYLNNKLAAKNLYKIAILGSIAILFMISQAGIIGQRVQDIFVEFKQAANTQFQVYAAGNDYNISDTGSIRQGLAKGSWKLITANPKNFIIGTGLETFPYEFQKHRPAELNYTSEWDFILNKPHNYYLELWAEIGLLGLIVYGGIIIESLKSKNKILVPGLVGFYIANFFGWPTVSTALLFWIFFAVITEKVKS